MKPPGPVAFVYEEARLAGCVARMLPPSAYCATSVPAWVVSFGVRSEKLGQDRGWLAATLQNSKEDAIARTRVLARNIK